MGCGGYSKINKPDVNGAVYRKITKEEIRVVIGNQVKLYNDGPVLIFVYGGPGSKKGRLISELIEVFGFTFVNVEKIMLQRMTVTDTQGVKNGAGDVSKSTNGEENKEAAAAPQGDETVCRKESLQELKRVIEDDPTAVSLRLILQEVVSEVEKNPKGHFLVDMMPNLKYIIRTANFSNDCPTIMAEFESKLPISFSLYFSLNMGPKKSSKEEKVEQQQQEVKEEKEDESQGFQSDEIDQSRTKRRASMFENSVRCFLDYFQASERLVSVDVSSRNMDSITSRVCEVFSQLQLCNQRLVNTALIFIFDSKGIDPDELLDFEVEYIRLEQDGKRLSVATLDDSVKSFVTSLNHKEHKTYLIDLSHTNICKNTAVEVSKTPSSILFINEEVTDRRFNLPGCQGVYKIVSSLGNAVCVFPSDTNDNLCKKIASSFNREFASPRNCF